MICLTIHDSPLETPFGVFTRTYRPGVDDCSLEDCEDSSDWDVEFTPTDTDLPTLRRFERFREFKVSFFIRKEDIVKVQASFVLLEFAFQFLRMQRPNQKEVLA